MITIVVFENISKIYPNNVTAVKDLTLTVNKAELMVLIGPSGCGKTTTLKMVNHLIEPTSGVIKLNGINTNDLNPVLLRRDIGYVIQNGGLFPHKTVAANIAIIPKLKKWSKAQINERIDELLKMVNMEPEIYRSRYPKELSGGQQQRIGVLRALAAKPDVILMDEPFGALDPITRDQLQDELKNLQKQVKKTILFVTHDMNEALKIADRIAILKEGEIIQLASPNELIQNPVNDFVKEFVGLHAQPSSFSSISISSIMSTQFAAVRNTEKVGNLKLAGKIKDETVLVTGPADEYLGMANLYASYPGLDDMLVGDIAESGTTINQNGDVKEAIEIIAEKNIKTLPVLASGQKPVGVITQHSIYKYILEMIS